MLSSANKLKYPPKINSKLLKSIKNIIDKRTNTGWGSISDSASHNPVDVQVFAFGPQSEVFRGFQDNTDIAKKIFTLLGKQSSTQE
jgi:alkaline phosphatase